VFILLYTTCILLGYLIGAINPTYIIGKLRGTNVKKEGSRNAGASNALILFGKGIGVLCALLDIGKVCLAVWSCAWLFPEESFLQITALTGSAAILGHIFPIFTAFKGGKGLACLGGTLLTLSPLIFLILLTLEAAVVLLVDYICVVPVTASVIIAIGYGFYSHDPIGTVALAVSAVVILFKHFENFKRIRNGTEAHFSLLWRKDRELERITRREDQP